MLGPGKYDDLCTMVRESAAARAAIVIIIDGDKGHGFSMQAPLGVTLAVADVLEQVARQIRTQVGSDRT